MAQINGVEQIQLGTITDGQISPSAAIALTKLIKAVITADGTVAYTGAQSFGGNKATNLAQGTSPNDAVTLAQVQALLMGISPLLSVQAMTTGAETYTISGGNVTQINGTVIDGISTLVVGDRILVKNAPASSGVGTADVSNAGTLVPANGTYTLTGVTPNLTMVRDSTSVTPLSGTVNPAGKIVYSEAGTANKSVGAIVVNPATPDTPFIYGTTNMQWGKLISAGGTVTTLSVASANGLAGTVANPATTPIITLTTTITGLLKGNATAISAAVAGTDYVGPANWVANETPGGTINNTNKIFTLANTPNTNVSSPLMLYQNGQLLDPTDDYSLSGTTITLINAPSSSPTLDKLRAYYWK
jgi:hypothetical protein